MRYSPRNLPPGWTYADGSYSSEDGWTIVPSKSLGYRHRGFVITRTDGGTFRFASTHHSQDQSFHTRLVDALRMLTEPPPAGGAWYVPDSQEGPA